MGGSPEKVLHVDDFGSKKRIYTANTTICQRNAIGEKTILKIDKKIFIGIMEYQYTATSK